MANLDKLFLWNGQVAFLGNDGRVFVPPGYPQAVYATYATDEIELPVATDAHRLSGATSSKRLFLVQSEAASGTRTGLLYTWEKDLQVNIIERGVSVHPNHLASEFSVVRGNGAYAWERDFATGRPGLFVTGTSGYGNIFRLARLELDTFSRTVFTLVPFRVVGVVPHVDFAGLQDGALREEAEEHYRELQAAFNAASARGLVKHIASVVEACLTDRLRSQGVATPRNLALMLVAVGRLLDRKETAALRKQGYHSAETIRLAYQRTHPEAAVRTDSPLEAEEALALLQDMKRVLSDLDLLA